MFDQNEYWLDRHKRLRGKLGSVGLINAPEESASKASLQFQNSIRAIAECLVKKQGSSRLLDIGCGIGRAAKPVCEAGMDYTGVDISPEAIEDAKTQFGDSGRFLVSDLLEFESDEPYDVVLAAWVLVHFVDDEKWDRMLRRIGSTITPGGAFVLIDVMASEESAPPKAHFKNRSILDYESRLGQQQILPDASLTEAAKKLDVADVVRRNLYIFKKRPSR